MKISFTTTLLVIFVIWLDHAQSVSMDYRYKRGPQRPHRPPPLPQYLRKWEQIRPTRNAVNKPRPIPMEQMAVVPIFAPPPVGPPIAQTPAPARNYWKTTNIPFQSVPEKPYQIIPDMSFKNQPEKPYQIILDRPFQTVPERPFQTILQRPYQPVPEKPYQPVPQKSYQTVSQKPYQIAPHKPFQVIPEKPFQSSPIINRIHEYDYQIQTNNIPTNSIPIKQVDEKGPIHTIPAPNLSLADRPIVVEEVYSETKAKAKQTYPQIQQPSVKAHQYQVTEPNEAYVKNTQKTFRDQQTPYRPNAYSSSTIQSYEKPQRQPQTNRLPELQSSVSSQWAEPQIGQKEFLQLINSHLQQDQQQQQPLQQQPLYDNYEIPPLPQAQALVQPQYQQQEISFADYQAMLAQAQLLQTDSTYLNQIQQMIASQHSNTNNQPQYQSYERRAQNSFSSEDQPSTFISTNYNLKAEAPSEIQDPSESESNSPYVKEIFNLEESEAGNNIVEQKPVLENIPIDQKNVPPAYYTTLPNQQAAETLASLQAAGKVNSNSKQINNQQIANLKASHTTPLEIYVPDSQQSKRYEVHSFKEEEQHSNQENVQGQDISEAEEPEYIESSFQDDIKNEEDDSLNQDNQNVFGNKIKPKQSKQ